MSVVSVACTMMCAACCSDLVIVTGDSRGFTSFWNGKQGILIKVSSTTPPALLQGSYGALKTLNVLEFKALKVLEFP